MQSFFQVLQIQGECMKKLLSIFVYAFVLIQANIFGLGDPLESFIVGYESFNCFHCTTQEDLQRIFSNSDNSQPFDSILEMIVDLQTANVQRTMSHLHAQHANKSEAERENYIRQYFLEGEPDAQSYIRKYYTTRYNDFVQKKSQLLIGVNATREIRGIFFFTVDATFNSALLICGECLIDIPKEYTFKILLQVWEIIARKFCENAKVLILGIPKAATPVMDRGFIHPTKMKPCEYTGSLINREIYDVFERPIEPE